MLQIAIYVMQRLPHQHVEQVRYFVHPIVHLTCIVGTITGVSKIDKLKVLVVPFFPPVLQVFDEKVLML